MGHDWKTDEARLLAISRAGLLDAAPDGHFDQLTRLASRAIGAPVCLFSVVTADRQYFTSQVGLAEPWASARETPLTHSFCQYVVRDERPLVVDNALENDLVVGNRAIDEMGVVAYAGVPLRTRAGEVLGSLCVIDSAARQWSEAEIEVLGEIADAVMAHVELRLAADALDQLRRRMDHILAFSPAVVLTLEQIAGGLEMTWVSSNIANVLGYSIEESLRPGWWYDNLHPEDRQYVASRNFDEVDTETRALEYRFRHGSGHWIWVREQLRRSGVGGAELVGSLTDISESVRRYQTREADRLRALLTDAPDLLTVLEADGVIRYESPSIERILGYSAEELVGRNAFDFVHTDDLARVAEAFSRVLAGESTTVSFRFRTASGEWRILEGIGRNLISDPTVGGIVFSSRDVTELRELENRYRQTQKMESLGLLAGGVAHDFNNLLTIILGNVQLVLSEEDSSNVPELTEILEAARRGRALTRQLLAFSRREPDTTEVTADARTGLTALRSLLERAIGSSITLHFDVQDTPLPVALSAGDLDQIVMNLVVNARDAVPAGGRIDVSARLDTGSSSSPKSARPWVRITVADNGVGMSDEVRARVFEPFYTTKPAGEGTGLGLATVYGLVRKGGGTIDLRSAPGQGTTFDIRLPQPGDRPAQNTSSTDSTS